MIKNILVPEKIGSYYLFSKRVIGFDIGKTVVHACKAYMHGFSITVEQCLEERIPAGENNDYLERAGQAIKAVLNAAGSYTSIHTAIDSSRVIFKKLTLPFVTYDKIKKVVYFEIEPLLPFPLHEAVVDFIIVDQNVKEGKSEILVAAVQHEQLDQHLQLFAQAGVSPEIVTVDLFALYGLYTCIPSYSKLEGDVVLIDLGINATRIAYIHDKHLNFIRTIPKGISAIAKMVAESSGIAITEAMKQIMRFGLADSGDQKYNDAINKALMTFWSDLSFTLRSFSMRTDELSINKILLLGIGSEIKGLSSFVQELLHAPCDLFRVSELFKEKNIAIKKKQHISSSNIISLSVALPSEVTGHFNLRQELEAATYATVVNRQIIIALAMVGILFVLLFIHSFLQVRKLRNEYTTSEKEAVKILKSRLPEVAQDSAKLARLVESARDVVVEKERQISLMNPARISYLNYLFELIERIDKKSLGFEIDRLVIADDVMTLKGSVRDFDALRKLEASLRESNLFNYTESQDKTDFEATIKLIQNNQEG